MLHTNPQDQPFQPAHKAAQTLHGQQLAKPHELLNADRHRVLLLNLESGDSLPEQLHLYASKTLVVMDGCATIVFNDTAKVLYEGESWTIPVCTQHRIVNSGKITARILDIRSGACVEDDDHAA